MRIVRTENNNYRVLNVEITGKTNNQPNKKNNNTNPPPPKKNVKTALKEKILEDRLYNTKTFL